MIFTFLVIVFGFLLNYNSVLAISSPTLSSPTNNSIISSDPTLKWQAVPESTQYRIIVDDQPNITSPYIKNYYTTNPYYSPKLNPGIYYWKVEAKDSSGVWSSWSEIWSFTLQTSLATPTPSPSSTPSPSPSASTPDTSSPTSSFTILSIPSQIDSNQPFTVLVNLSLPSSPNTNFYLKGAFKKAGGSNYFGLTKVSGNWIKNSSTYSNQYPITTDSSGNWSGNLEVQPDSEDSGYTGTEDYIFKVGKYTSSGSGPSWSNESTIKIIATSSQGASPTEDSATTSVSPSPTSSSSQTKTSNLALPKVKSKLDYQTASVAAATASSSPVSGVGIKGTKFPNLLPFLGAVLLTLGIGSLIFTFLTKSKRQGSASTKL